MHIETEKTLYTFITDKPEHNADRYKSIWDLTHTSSPVIADINQRLGGYGFRFRAVPADMEDGTWMARIEMEFTCPSGKKSEPFKTFGFLQRWRKTDTPKGGE